MNETKRGGPRFQEPRQSAPAPMPKKKKKSGLLGRIVRRFFLLLFTVILLAVAALCLVMNLVFNGPSPAARDVLTMSLLEPSATKWIPGLFMDEEIVESIRNAGKDNEIKEENLRLRDHEPAELAFYSRATTDIEYAFPFTDWGELWGIADRTNYDLSRHQEASGKDLTYFDQETNEHYIPYVIEPSLGCDRVALAFLCEAYDEEVVGQDKNGKADVRTVLHLHPALAPFKVAVLPLSKKLSDKALEIKQELSKDWMVDFDETGSIGKRYRREDEIGTPFCVTVDFDTVGDDTKEGDNCVTVRDRDTMEQVRLPISELKAYLAEKLAY